MPPAAIKVHDLQPYNDNLRGVRGVEVFRVGEWNGEEYTADDLDQMVLAFNTVGFQVPLKIGHAEMDGAPAYGWVDRVYRIGQVMKADFRDVPVWIFDTVFIDHRYDHVSIEIYFNLKRDGKTYKRALKAIALLGAETPAVSGLAPLRDAIFALGASDTFDKVALHELQVKDAPMPEPVTRQEPAAVATLTQEQATALIASQAELKAANEALVASLKKQGEDQTALLAQFAELNETQKVATVAAKVALCKLPALAPLLTHLYSHIPAATVVKFATVNAAGATIVADKTLGEVLDDLVTHVNKFAAGFTGPQRLHAVPNTATLTSVVNASQELSDKVTAYMGANPDLKGAAGFQAATRAVLAADPDLAERYKAFTRGQAA